MPAIVTTIGERDLLRVLGNFIASHVDCEVVRGLGNRTPMPTGDFISMTPGSSMALSTPVSSYDDTTQTIKQSKQWGVQIDCYGALANDRAQVIATLFRTAYACDVFAASGLEIQPLYAGDPQQLPLVSGELQYVERWTFDAVLQYNPCVALPQDSADTLTINLVNVEANYPSTGA